MNIQIFGLLFVYLNTKIGNQFFVCCFLTNLTKFNKISANNLPFTYANFKAAYHHFNSTK